MKGRGLFVTFEGPEGGGKSTQLQMLAARLREAGQDVVVTREPGGTEVGDQIRRLLLDPANRGITPTAELLLMFASRAQNVDEVILPALSAGRIVLADRFTDSTLAYQGAARGLGAEVVYELDRIACRGLVPNLTLLVDIEAEAGLERARRRNASTGESDTRFDEHDAAFHRKVREAYRQIAGDEPGRVVMVDGSRSVEEVAAEVWEAVAGRLHK